VTVWVRPDDHRFDNDLSKINNPAIKISATDGSIVSIIAREDFPLASILSAPSTTDYSFNPMNVANNKADATFLENEVGYEYLQANPGTLRAIGLNKPLRTFPIMMLVDKGEFKLQSMLNGIIRQMAVDGTVDKILKKYEKSPGAYYRIAAPYQINP
jgi:ABC-type amino acid transport substrate-binding protein